MQSDVEEKINLASALSLSSAIITLLGSIFFLWMYNLIVSSTFDFDAHHHMMGMMSFFWFSGTFWIFFALGLISGGIVLAASILLKEKPKNRTLYGTLIIVFSVLSIFSGGGFIIGALLGLVGGIIAVG
ncbi:MAG: hypothetical protein ACP5K8_04120 [Nitrososphaeria archaeon]